MREAPAASDGDGPVMPSLPWRPDHGSLGGRLRGSPNIRTTVRSPVVACLMISDGPALELPNGAWCRAAHPPSCSTGVPPEAIRAIIAAVDVAGHSSERARGRMDR